VHYQIGLKDVPLLLEILQTALSVIQHFYLRPECLFKRVFNNPAVCDVHIMSAGQYEAQATDFYRYKPYLSGSLKNLH
jgi:hypothetical protein